MKTSAATAAVLFATVVCLGRLLHYTDLGVYLAFALLVTPVVAAASMFGGATSVDGDAAVRTMVAGFAIVVASALVLGGIGRLSRTGFVWCEIGFLGAAVVVTRGREARNGKPESEWTTGLLAWPAPAIGLVAALLAFAVGFGITHAPLTLYDSISYHLHFVARWLQDRSLSIVATPFSDEAQAYAPANGELFFLWLMMPFHGDLLARIGQLPFALVAAATLDTLARRIGASEAHAVYPPIFFLLSRQVLEQTIGANVDLICAAMFFAAIYFGILAVDRNRSIDWLWFGVAAGLYAGSKYVALVYLPVLALFVVVRRPKARMLWALPGLIVFAMPWYLRNWILAGSPIYPATLEVAGLTIARGAFTRAAMLKTIFHTTDVRLVPLMAAHAFGPTLFVFFLPLAAVGGWRMARAGWWPRGFLVAVPVLMAPLYWFGIPVNVDSRFFMPAIAPSLLPLAFVFSRSRRWNAVAHAICAGGIAWILVGTTAAVRVNAPWFMTGWFALDGLIGSRFLVGFVALGAAVTAAWWISARRTAWAVPLTVAVSAASAVLLASGDERWCAPNHCGYLKVTSPYIRTDYLSSWYWLNDHVKNSTVAYTGINVPYPLTGERLTNRVVYVNIDGHLRWRFHDYDRAYRAGRFEPSDPPLATSSGELVPVVARPGPRDDASRPRYERMRGVRDGWVYDLDRLGVDYVFVAVLSAYEIDYVWHNDAGFPIEDEWAKAEPTKFQLVFENRKVHIYAVRGARV